MLATLIIEDRVVIIHWSCKPQPVSTSKFSFMSYLCNLTQVYYFNMTYLYYFAFHFVEKKVGYSPFLLLILLT